MFNRIFWGIVLIALGIFFILEQRGVVTFDLGHTLSTYWPLILIYFGLKGLFFQYKWGQGIGFGFLWPLLLTIVGVYFLGHNIDYITMSAGEFFQFVIPFILIVIGVLIVLSPGRRRSRSATEHGGEAAFDYGEQPDPAADYGAEDKATDTYTYETEEPPYEPKWQDEGADDHAYHKKSYQKEKLENHFSFIGDIHIGSANWQLRPLNINHFIGDTVVDLTRADIPDGVTKISIGSLIGDVKVLLPSDLDVEPSITMSSVIGEFYVFGKREGGMFKNHREESSHYPLAKKRIQIMVNLLIGDFRVERI